MSVTMATQEKGSSLIASNKVVPFENETLQLRVQTMTVQPAGPLRGIILYLSGFADSVDREVDFFKTLADQGYRVIG